MRRAIVFAAVVLTALGLSAASAYAFSCSVVKKPAGAGSAGSATVNVVTGEFTPGADLRVNKAGHIQGGFISVTAVLPDGTVVGGGDVFGHADLPDGAHSSGPGDSECDGVGIDDLAECG
jgi:hypothetical protein